MKKLVLSAMFAAALAALCFITGCSKSEDGDSVYKIELGMEGENSKLISPKDTDVQNAYDQITSKLTDLRKEVEEEWIKKGNADKDAKARFTKAKDRLVEVEKECKTIIDAIPSGSASTFKVSRALLLRKISAGSGDETIEKYAISLKYPAE